MKPERWRFRSASVRKRHPFWWTGDDAKPESAPTTLKTAATPTELPECALQSHATNTADSKTENAGKEDADEKKDESFIDKAARSPVPLIWPRVA